MAGSVNKVILVGNLGRDPEIRTMQSGDKVVNLALATSESWKDKNTGERQERTEWHRISIFNQGLVKIAENYLRKGSKIYVEGQLETRKWTDQQTGQDRYTTEIVLRPYRGELTMLDSRGGEGGGFRDNNMQQGGYDSGPAFGPSVGAQSGGGSQNQQKIDELEDEIPF